MVQCIRTVNPPSIETLQQFCKVLRSLEKLGVCFALDCSPQTPKRVAQLGVELTTPGLFSQSAALNPRLLDPFHVYGSIHFRDF
jgi:hypothetical protein